MREILFRGFHKCENGKQKAFYNCEWHTGEWVCGKSILFLKENGGEYYMPKCDEKCKTIHLENGDIEEINCADYNTAFYKVAPETVCQYTGLKDKNDKKIYDGDIINYKWKLAENYEPKLPFVVEYCESEYTAVPVYHYNGDVWEIRICGYNKNFEVIGNKFETPELVEVEE